MKWPSHRSLFGRSVTTLVLFTLAFQVLVYSVSAVLVVWPLLKSAADDLAGIMVLSTRTLSHLPVTERPRLLAELQSLNHLNASAPNGPLPGRPSWLPFANQLEESLSARLGQPAKVRIMEGVYHVDVSVPGLTLRFAFPHSRLGTSPILAAALLFVATLLLSFAAAVVVARRFARPLNALSTAAEEVGRGGVPQIGNTDNVAELDTLVNAFNAMAREVRAMVNNRTTLLAGISHDLRSPITRARIAVELAKDTSDLSLMHDIDRYLAQMETLLGEFLDFARGVEGIQSHPMILKEVVHGLCTDFAEEAPLVRCTGESSLQKVDRVALERVLRNLVDNARRYGGGQPVEVCCAVENGNTLIEVRDRGPGIPENQHMRVFEPFVRLEGSRNRTTGGSGLGLAIVREICGAQGWRIGLANREGGGLVARLIIPGATARLRDPDNPYPANPSSSPINA